MEKNARPLIVTVSGKARNGKDYIADKLCKKLRELGVNTVVAHYADELKFICKQFYGWNGEKDDAGRHLLQYVGTEMYRSKDLHFWVKRLISIFSFQNKGDFVDCGTYKWSAPDVIVIPDTRFPNEILGWLAYGYRVLPIAVVRTNVKMCDPTKDAIKLEGIDVGSFAKLLKENEIEIVKFNNGLTGEAQQHASETALDKYVFKHDNNDLNLKIRVANGDCNMKLAGENSRPEERKVYATTAALYMNLNTNKELAEQGFITSELDHIPFEKHLDHVFQKYIDLEMVIIQNITGVDSVTDVSINGLAASIKNMIGA